MLVAKSLFGVGDELLEKFKDTPNDIKKLLDKRKKDLLPTITAINDMMATKGWKEVVGPFLEKNGNPSRLFSLHKKKFDTPEAKGMAFGKVEAYNNLLNLLRNLVSVLEIEDQQE